MDQTPSTSPSQAAVPSTPPAVSPTVPTTSPSPTPPVGTPPSGEGGKPSVNKKPFIVGVGIAAMLVIFGLGFSIARLTNKPPVPDVVPSITPTQPSGNQPTVPVKASSVQHLLYIKDNNIFSLASDKKREQQLTTDGSTLIRYTQPQWISTNSISYTRCVHENEQDTRPYTCTLSTKTLGGETKNIITLTAQKNYNGIYSGGTIQTYAWNPRFTQIAYLSNEAPTASEAQEDPFLHGKDVVRIRDVAQQSEQTLTEFKRFGGRGGSLDDDLSLHFSPDSKKLLFNYTLIQETDKGTLFVYDIASQSVIWQQANRITTFGRWLDTDTFVAKQLPSDGTTTGGTLIRANISSHAIDTIGFIGNAYAPYVLSKDEIVFFSINPLVDEGIRIERFNLTTASKQLIKDNVLLKGVANSGTILVEQMEPCNPAGTGEGSCGIDIYNGYLPTNRLSLLDIASKEEIALPIVRPQTFIDQIDLQ